MIAAGGGLGPGDLPKGRRGGWNWPVTLGWSYAAVIAAATPLVAEARQPVAWMPLDEDWESYFPVGRRRVPPYGPETARAGVP